MKTRFQTASAQLFLSLVSCIFSFGFISCADEATIAENDIVRLPIETIPALYTLDCSRVVDVQNVTFSGVFSVNTFVRKKGLAQHRLYHSANGSFDDGTNQLRLKGSSPLYRPSSDYEYKVIAVYPCEGKVDLDSNGFPIYENCTIAAESEWLQSNLQSYPYLDFHPL